MKYQVGSIILNAAKKATIEPTDTKSKKYLLPCLKDYGQIFTNKLNSVFKVCIGVGDVILCDHSSAKYEQHLFILIDTRYAVSHFIDFITWIKTQTVYEEDYVFGNIQTSPFHMVVIKFPDRFLEVYGKFKKGEYSAMFTKADVDKYFRNHPETTKVLVKDHEYNLEFTKELNQIYGTTLKDGDYDGELDLPPVKNEEIFNSHLKRKKC